MYDRDRVNHDTRRANETDWALLIADWMTQLGCSAASQHQLTATTMAICIVFALYSFEYKYIT